MCKGDGECGGEMREVIVFGPLLILQRSYNAVLLPYRQVMIEEYYSLNNRVQVDIHVAVILQLKVFMFLIYAFRFFFIFVHFF
jgi:hypothetical protein